MYLTASFTGMMPVMRKKALCRIVLVLPPRPISRAILVALMM